MYSYSPFRKTYTAPDSAGCPFCNAAAMAAQVVRRQDGSAIENEHYRFVVNTYPKFEGHTMLVPKAHLLDFAEETPEAVLARQTLLLEAVALLRRAFPNCGIENFIQTGAGSKSSVAHLHWHLVPAYEHDPLRSFEKLGHFYTTTPHEEKVVIFPKAITMEPATLLARSGVTEVLVLLNGQHPELILETIGSGEALGLTVYYRYTRETHGASVGRHLALAREWVGTEAFLLLLGDSFFTLETIPDLETAKAPHIWAFQDDPAHDDMTKYAPVPYYPGLRQSGLWLFNESLFTAVTALANEPELRIRQLVKLVTQAVLPNVTVLPPQSFIDCGTPEAIRRAEALVRH